MHKVTVAIAALAVAAPTIPAAPAFAHRYQGTTNHTHCVKRNGTTGIIVGGAGGALVGRALDRRGSRATGTILGAAAGAVIGREVARNRSVRRCR
jgi:outer membrane lipoprotein SlyB